MLVSGTSSTVVPTCTPFREYRDVTPLGSGEEYVARVFVSRESLRRIVAAGGRS